MGMPGLPVKTFNLILFFVKANVGPVFTQKRITGYFSPGGINLKHE
jgi:hypothetical protein